jgi:hypothetical protein
MWSLNRLSSDRPSWLIGGLAVDVSVDYQGNVIQAGKQGTTAPSNATPGGTGR